jgi:hypothetical protein
VLRQVTGSPIIDRGKSRSMVDRVSGKVRQACLCLGGQLIQLGIPRLAYWGSVHPRLAAATDYTVWPMGLALILGLTLPTWRSHCGHQRLKLLQRVSPHTNRACGRG